jgi:hypothetical protein
MTGEPPLCGRGKLVVAEIQSHEVLTPEVREDRLFVHQNLNPEEKERRRSISRRYRLSSEPGSSAASVSALRNDRRQPWFTFAEAGTWRRLPLHRVPSTITARATKGDYLFRSVPEAELVALVRERCVEMVE